MARKSKGKSKAKAEQFSQTEMSVSDPAFAAWLLGTSDDTEAVNVTTVLGISAVLRSVSVITQTIASLPLRTYERVSVDERQRIPSVFDDPCGPIDDDDGMTPFSFVETTLIHELLWRSAFLWHDAFDRDGNVSRFRPIIPDAFEVKVRAGGRKRFAFTDPDTRERREVGNDLVTYIPGPSLDGYHGHPFLSGARAIFSAAISGDKAAQKTLRQGIRLAGLITPSAEGEDIDPTEGEEILEQLRPRIVGRENAGDIAFINRRLKLEKWTPTNVESQWNESRQYVLGEIGRLFGMPAHLLNDTEKQTSWGTGVAEQNLGLQRYTLIGWSSRTEQGLTRRLPKGQFVEFDYTGLLQGTPAQEIELLIAQVEAGLITVPEARRIRNYAPLTPEQKAEIDARLSGPLPRSIRPARQEVAA